MSDFDEEAERERLREKYERDKQKRQTTEKMSELLLQGATMTNAHCSDCNDPIFRYDGQEFCATCEKPVDRDTADGDAADEAGEQENGQGAGTVEVTSPSDDARVSFGAGQEGAADGEAPERQPRAQADRPQDAQARTDSDQPRTGAGDAPRETEARRQPRTGGTDADVGAVRESLVRTLRRFSEQAEACEDPQRAREHLAAAREAAETLEALRR